MKRKTLAVICCIFLFGSIFSALGGSGEDENLKDNTSNSIVSQEDISTSTTDNTTADLPEISADEKIRSAVSDVIKENYSSTVIDSISINEDLGTETEGDYIVLAYLTWNVKNSASTTLEMMALYSEDFAARIGSDIPNISEVSVFWTIPYYSESDIAVKYSYERKDNGMYQTDKMIASFLN